MKHAITEDLYGFEDILSRIRSINELKERIPLHFYYKGRGIAHFHIDVDIIYADVGQNRIRIGTRNNPDQSAEDLLYESILKEIQTSL